MTSNVVNVVGTVCLAFIVYVWFHVRPKNYKTILFTKEPFLIFPNHTNQWDPFIISCLSPRTIHWVASDGVFRDSKLKPMLYLAGTIPTVKGQSDIAILATIHRILSKRHAVGIFPEGNQTWDGHSLTLLESTAKLVRLSKCSVIVPLIKGGFLTKPRWSWGGRRCRIEVHFQRVIDKQEIRNMTLSEIRQRLEKALNHDEYTWQKTALAPIRSKRRSEHLEVVHYMCPACHSIGTLLSMGNNMRCQCGYTVHVDIYGFLQYPQSGPKFDSPRDWINWQNAFLLKSFKKLLKEASPGQDPVLLCDADVILMHSVKAIKIRPLLRGEARLYKDRIEVGDGDEIMSFPLNALSALTTFKQQNFEFVFQKNQYRFSMPSRHVSGYKWEVASKGLLQYVKQEKKNPSL